MPTRKVKNGYKWGKHGKVYPTKKQADKQGQAIYASGWKENKIIEEINSNMKHIIRINETELNNIIKESVRKLLKENTLNNFNNKYEYLTDLLDRYRNMVSDGITLSNNQISQIEEIYDFLLQTNSQDNLIHDNWIEIAKSLLGNNNLNEGYKDFNGYDNDLNYDSLYSQAEHYLITKKPSVLEWREIAEEMGFQLKTIGPNDMETLKDAIEDAMFEYLMSESINKVLKETFSNSYTHYAVNKKTNLIVNGWDYSGYSGSELSSDKNYYFNDDLRDNEFNPKDYKILTKRSCLKMGINPDDIQNCWSNNGEIPCGEENRLKEPINEISADLAFKAADSAYRKAREGYGKYNNTNEIPHNSYHGKKFAQGEKFLTYGRNKLNKGNNDVGIYYIGDKIALKNYKTGEFLTKPCNSIEELEFEINNK